MDPTAILQPQQQIEESFVYAGQCPQAVASPEAEAAMGATPDERGYYRSRFDGKLYAKVYVRGTGTFSDGTPMTLGEKRYFQVQPIAWYPYFLSEDKGILVSRHVLFTCPFDDSSNEWGTSYVRKELQNFALACLDARTKARITDLVLDNDSLGQETVLDGRSVVLSADNAPWCVQPLTWDGVFLFSRPEIEGMQSPSRPFSPTDYARAMGAVATPDGLGTGWLRTADATATRAATFGFDQIASLVLPDTGREVTDELGVLPVLSVTMP